MASPFDGLVGAFGSPATLYDADGVSNARRTTAAISSARYVPMIGTARGNIILCYFPTGTDVSMGDVLRLLSPERWYVVAKAMDVALSPAMAGMVTPGQSASLLGLPLEVTRLRPSASQHAAARDPWSGLTGAALAEAADAATIRAGMSNEFNPADPGIEGLLPRTGVETLYVPLQADVRHGDTVTLPDGRASVVNRANVLYADGAPYALQLLLNLSGGSGLRTS